MGRPGVQVGDQGGFHGGSDGERRWIQELFRRQNEQDLVMGWLLGEEGESQGGLPGNGFEK